MRDRLLPDLTTIAALARSGSLERAWELFERGGYGDAADASTLAVKGRLLKDRAARASGANRAALYGDAAEAYTRAAGDAGATYPLINAATLTLLAGNPERSALLAERVLTQIAANPDEPETPYYQAATRAEALLLLGRVAEARAALNEAIALAPRAWEDHASTLRQFGLILGTQGADAGWLEPLRPPRSLHFGGHMSFRADIAQTALTGDIAAVLAQERIGFGYGALAAGADILVAEALLARGVELHLVIPGGIEAFAALSVDPFAGWRGRFDAILARAETVRAVEPAGVLPDSVAIGLADEIAMGAARINAQRLASEAVQLLVVADGEGEGRSQAIWAGGGTRARQHVLRAPRQPVAPGPDAAPAVQRCLAALAIRADAAALAGIRRVLAEGAAPVVPPSFTGEAAVLAFDRLADAAACATALAAALPGVSVGGGYGVADTVNDPFGGGQKLVGRALAIALAASGSAPAGSAFVSDDFAAALAVIDPGRFHAEYVGELEDMRGAAPVGLFALRRL